MLCFLLQFLKQPTQENFSDRKKPKQTKNPHMLAYLIPASLFVLGRVGNTCEEQKKDKAVMVAHLNQIAKSIGE